jgi:acetyl-CoA C-acetyltransferase
MTDSLRRVAIVGGSRIPFCRSNTMYADNSNLDMLSTVLDGIVQRFDLAGEQLDEVMAGAVITHSKDFNLAREAVLSSKLSPLTPGITLQQACGTSLQAALSLGAKIASGQIECGIAAGSDTTSDAPIVFGDKFAGRMIRLSQARTMKQRMAALKGFSPGELKPVTPTNGELRTGLSMGQHC